ncbi:hypothetical protein OIV83_000476 [Microbotryomycetes sp. JL201]|nr:hypothetical protein OIV83_000476 [Microbotryomycetes sp. JL201]
MRVFRMLRQATSAASQYAPRQKQSLPLTGLDVHHDPIPALTGLYKSTLQLLQQAPASAVYRQSVESITRDRLTVVEQFAGQGTEQDIEAIEQRIGCGYIEEVIKQADDELKLAAKLIEVKAWEDLESPPEPGQWAPFKITPSTTSADDLK